MIRTDFNKSWILYYRFLKAFDDIVFIVDDQQKEPCLELVFSDVGLRDVHTIQPPCPRIVVYC